MYSPPPSHDLELAGGADAPLARIEAKHDLAERDEVVAALLGRPDRETAHRVHLGAEGDGLPRQARDGCEVPGGDQLRCHHPASADGSHGRQREIGGGVRRADAAGRDEANAGKRPLQRAQERDATGRLRREELEEIEALVEGGDHLGRRRHAGDHEDVELAAPLDHARAEAGRDDEPRACLDRHVDLLGPDDRPGPDEDVRLGGEQPDRLRGSLRPERDLGAPAAHPSTSASAERHARSRAP